MPLRQLYPPGEDEGDDKARVDIVAVHGLNPYSKSDEQHAWDTWRKPTGPAGRLWLRDDLPKFAPRSRIFLYEYNSTLVYGGDKSRFIDKANDLLEALRAERKKDDKRPLIFISHSLGGILIEQALVNAHNNSKYSAIREATTSLVFFGTPHAGGDDRLVALGSAAARIAKHIHVQPPNDIIETLKKGSLFTDVLAEHWRQQLESYQIVSFWEGVGDIVPKKSATFGLPGHRENIVRLDASHSDMCRFDGISQRDKDNLKIVLSNLGDAYEEALRSCESANDAHLSELNAEVVGRDLEDRVSAKSPTPATFTLDQKACLQSLQFPEMHWRKNDVADPARATCTWILEHTKYCEWLDQGQGLLWIKGKPGAGKSTVLKLALETAERETKESSILASYFFHGRGKPIQKNVLGLFRSLLHQMLQQNRDLLSKFTSLYREKCDTEGPCGNKWNWHESQLQTFFKSSVVDTARTHQIRIYIDALDECGQDVALDLVEFFRCFATPISICFSCRHYPFVALEGGNEVCVENENAQDIKAYIQDKIEAHIQQTEIATAIRDEIMSRSEGNFQWVVLVMPRVLKLHKSRKSLATIQTMIRNTPAELKELYTELLDGIEEHERLQSLHFMQWICFAIEPLTLTELRFALVANADTSHTSISRCQRSELYVETNEDMERRVWDLSKGLAEVLEEDEEQIVQFNHQSVNDFLLEKGLQILDNSAAGTVVGRGHFWLSRSSIKFLTMQEVQGFAISLLDMSRLEKSMVEEEEDYFAFLWYSVTFWLLHVEKVENANMPQEDLAVLNFKPTDGILLHSRFDSWFAMYQELQSWSNDCPSEGRTFLHTASEYNLISVVKTLLTQNVLADQKDESSRTPLSIAAERGHELLVDLLVNRDDVDADSKDVRGNTPLFWAAAEGHEAVVEMLMNRDDVDVDSRNLQGHTPFSKAVKSGHERVARLLIVRDDVDADSRDCGGDTPLIKAAQYRFYAIIELLLKRNDVDVNWRNHRGDSLFSVAARSGRKAAVEMLLERGVDLSSENGQLTTALFGASTEGYHEIVTLLLQKNADANARDEENRTPLSWAANYGQYEVVELLLSQGSNADQKDTRGRTPLSYAAGSRGEETVKKFVKRSDVNVDSKDLLGRTPLSYAAGSGGMETVKLLLERSDVNVDSKDLTGRTPLSHAAENGKNETVNLLLERSDVDVNSKDTTGRTPLSYAAECGMEKIVKLLVKRSDIEVLSKDTSGRSALSWALEKVPSSGPYPIEDRMRIVDLLLSRHDISLTGKDQDAFMVYSIWRKANGYT